MTTASMGVALFIVVEGPDEVSSVEAGLEGAVAPLAGLREALLHRRLERAPDHPFAQDGAGPSLVVELRFAALADAEAALQPDRLGRLAPPEMPPARIGHQAFAAHDFAVPDPEIRAAEPCTFLVAYPGPSVDPAAWLDHYDANHPPIMCRFPGVRRVATYRPLAWTGGLPWARGRAMQRNKVVFDTPAGLTAALASPVMAEMRADRDGFPPFEGGATHFPMRTRILR